jgi:hypothetical protein
LRREDVFDADELQDFIKEVSEALSYLDFKIRKLFL